MQENDLNFRNILVIDFGQLGDVVLSLPALKAIRERFPSAHIAVLAGMATGDVVALSGLADEIVNIDRVELRDGPKLLSISKILRLVGKIRRRRIDLVIDLHSLPETNILAFLSRARHRLLANRDSRSLDRLSNFRPKPPVEDKTKHLSVRYLDVLKPLRINGADADFRFQPSPVDLEYVEQRFFSGVTHQTVGLFPGAGHPSRCWSLEGFASLSERLVADRLRPAVFLGPEEQNLKARIAEIMPDSVTIIDGLSVSQFIAAAGCVAAFVTNDTGPMHLAACAGAPILLLMDERAPLTYLPLTERLVVVRDKAIGQISVDAVYCGVMGLMRKYQPTVE